MAVSAAQRLDAAVVRALKVSKSVVRFLPPGPLISISHSSCMYVLATRGQPSACPSTYFYPSRL